MKKSSRASLQVAIESWLKTQPAQLGRLLNHASQGRGIKISPTTILTVETVAMHMTKAAYGVFQAMAAAMDVEEETNGAASGQ